MHINGLLSELFERTSLLWWDLYKDPAKGIPRARYELQNVQIFCSYELHMSQTLC